MAQRKRGHVRHVAGNRWRLHYEGARDPITGRRRQFSRTVTADNQRAAVRALNAWLAELDNKRTTPANVTVGELLDEWIEHAAAEPNTIQSWREALDAYIRPRLGSLPLAKLDVETLDRHYQWLALHGGRKGTGVKPATIRKAHTPLRKALDQARRWRWIDVNPAVDARPKPAKSKMIEPPSNKIVQALIDSAPPDLSTWIRLAAMTGARREETLGLHWADIDLDAGEILIQRVVKLVGANPVVADYPKSSRSRRRIALFDDTLAALRSHRARQAEMLLSLGLALQPSTFVFHRFMQPDVPWHPTTLTHRFIKHRRSIGGAAVDVRLYDLRHYAATEMLAAGMDVVTVAGRLGHDPNVTLKVYAHFVPANDRIAAEILERRLKGG